MSITTIGLHSQQSLQISWSTNFADSAQHSSVAESVDVVNIGIEAVLFTYVSEVGSAEVSDADVEEHHDSC